MNAIKAYILSIVVCGFLISLLSVIPVGMKTRYSLKLCGGCLMALVVLQPILGIKLNGLPDWIINYEPIDSDAMQQAEERNEVILKEFMQEQIEAALTEAAESKGILAEIIIHLSKDETSETYIPDAVVIRGTFTSSQRESFSAILEEEWGIPAERQRWLLP